MIGGGAIDPCIYDGIILGIIDGCCWGGAGCWMTIVCGGGGCCCWGNSVAVGAMTTGWGIIPVGCGCTKIVRWLLLPPRLCIRRRGRRSWPPLLLLRPLVATWNTIGSMSERFGGRKGRMGHSCCGKCCGNCGMKRGIVILF
jgi:hypothetical protein